MLHREWRLHVEDMLQACLTVGVFIRGLDYEAFASDQKVVHAVLYNLAILGEAVRSVPPEVQTKYTDVPWARARAMRNKVIHEYHGVSLPILWDTITVDLPALASLLQAMLDAETSAE
ncbi:MAG: DUF86 domain-containing protein [Chloroflexi bacterium]|nr:DUF86 domain-containing protein [Chloroflexota bacterium]